MQPPPRLALPSLTVGSACKWTGLDDCADATDAAARLSAKPLGQAQTHTHTHSSACMRYRSGDAAEGAVKGAALQVMMPVYPTVVRTTTIYLSIYIYI